MDFDILDLKPADLPEYAIPAWLGCISWALGEPAVVADFRAKTGNAYQPARNGFEQLIDDATGVRDNFIRQFVTFVNDEIWGPWEGESPT